VNGVLVKRRRHRYEAVLELTPLIDVIFLLLIFFMVSTSFVVTKEIPIQLPESSGAAAESKLEALVIGIDASGNFSVNGSVLSATGTDEITAALLLQAQNGVGASVPVRIDGHESVDYKFVIRAMDACRKAGFTDVRLSTVKSVN
jgi:biopolymer transport protein ExbD